MLTLHRRALNHPDFLDYDTVAARLGCSTKTVRRAVDAGQIHAIAVGRFRRIHRTELARLLRDAATLPDIASGAAAPDAAAPAGI